MDNATLKKYRQIDREYVWHPYTKHSNFEESPFPILKRGEGLYLFDTEGNRYLDAISSWWSCNLGHCHPEIVETIQKQAAILEHCILGNLSHPTILTLSEKLCTLFNDPGRHVHYASDGACAVEAALKIAIQYWYNTGNIKRNRFASLKGGYHGDTLGALSVGFIESFHKPFTSSIIPSYSAEAPFCRSCIYGKNEDTCAVECFQSMENIFTDHSEELAAVIVEPLCQGTAGMRIYSHKYLSKLQTTCEKHKVLLIIDEIAMGYGRTGKMFAHQHAGIDPDIVCIGKGISNGTLPISATIVKNKIYHTFTDKPHDNTFYHGHTFAGNPLAATVALKVLEIYSRDGIVQKAEKLGHVLHEGINTFETLPNVLNTRTLGMIGAIELCEGPVSYQSHDVTRTEAARRILFSKGILLRPLGNVLYLMLPLVVSKSVLQETVETIYTAVKEIG